MGIFITPRLAAGLTVWNNIDSSYSHWAKDWLPADKPGYLDNPPRKPVFFSLPNMSWGWPGGTGPSPCFYIKANLWEDDWRTHKHICWLRATQRRRMGVCVCLCMIFLLECESALTASGSAFRDARASFFASNSAWMLSLRLITAWNRAANDWWRKLRFTHY